MSKKILFLFLALIIGASFFVGVQFSLAANPSISNLSPTSGPSNISVVIYGSNFTLTGNQINFFCPAISSGGGEASVSSVDGISLVTHVSTLAVQAGTTISYPLSCTVSITNVNGTSNLVPFTITSPSTQPSVTILLPNGGEIYKNDGSSITVNWQTNNVPASHVIDIIRLRVYPSGREYNLATNVLNDGQEVISIPSSVPVGAYTLEIKTYVGETLVMDSSDSYFKVVDVSQPSITILSPNGGETWSKGITQTIKWQDSYTGCVTNSTGTTACVDSSARLYDLKLAPYYPPCTGQLCPAYAYRAPYPIATGVSGNIFQWSVGKIIDTYGSGEIAPDGAYTVQICLSGSGTPCVSSDSYFKIVAGTTQPATPNLTVTNFKSGNINDQNNVSTQIEFDLVNNDSSAATFYLVAWNDTTNFSLKSELYTLTANQTVHVQLMNVNNISHLAQGANAINIKEVSSDSQTVYNSQDFTVTRNQNTAPVTPDTQISQINNNANLITNDKMGEILAELNQLRSIVKEQQTQIKYLSSILKDVNGVSADSQATLNNFITYGVDANTEKLGAGERAAVVNSYKAAFDKLPTTEAELADVIKIANGRWPSITNKTAEDQAKAQFQKIYQRTADMNNANDNAAVTVMAYGLRQKAGNRNLNSETNGIKIFKAIYGHTPNSTEDWNIMQAITYSGASR